MEPFILILIGYISYLVAEIFHFSGIVRSVSAYLGWRCRAASRAKFFILLAHGCGLVLPSRSHCLSVSIMVCGMLMKHYAAKNIQKTSRVRYPIAKRHLYASLMT